MSTYSNIQSLSTYLSTVGTGAPATTATALIQGLTPIFFNFTGDTTPHYGPGDPTAINTLAGSQKKYSAILYPSTGTPIGVTLGDNIGLLTQALKETISTLGNLTTYTVTTNASGVATINISALGLTNAPRVVCTPTNNSSPFTVNAQVSTKSNTSIGIFTTITQNILLGIVNPTTPVSTPVDVFVYSLG